jgi:NADPH-dependent 2,4-dienoyl-CoA reductase/sulfur reductase-like enzyme
MKVIIVGGVAGGASCAARLRRLDEKAEILMVERGPYVSYANCGLPYHVSGVIPEESSLLVATEQMFRAVFNIEVRTGCEAVSISPKQKTVELRDVKTGKVTTESYDKLVLSPGAAPIRPPLPGIDLPGIFSVRTVPDARTIREWLHRGEETKTGMDSYTDHQIVTKPKRAVVVGGGFIGLEMVENFAHLGLEVTLVEKLNQVMPPLDPEMSRLVERYLVKHGVNLQLADGVAGFRQAADGSLEVLTESGKAHPADVVILAIGVRPETALAKAAGLEIGQRGGIRVDEHMTTSDPDILAVGDAVEVKDYVTGQWTLIPLAGPANRQGRIAADVIAGRDSRYRGTQGTSICKIFEGEIGQTGPSEKVLRQLGETDFEKLYLYQNSHAGYFPGAKMMAIKVLFRKKDGRLLGAQVLAEDGVAKRIDAFAMAIQMKATVYDLEEAELCYAPPFGSAKDPVNFAGMVAGNLLRGDMPIVHWEGTGQGFLLDMRNPRNSRSSPFQAPSTSRCPSFAAASGSCPATRRSWSSAARPCAPTTRRAS